jgi:3',5'-cyclic AMP phosphodiesterase CpdA
MFTLAHLSDWHLASAPRAAELKLKRALGLINWHRGRKYVHRPDVLEATLRDAAASGSDHVAVTGDLVNFSLPAEYERAGALLATLGPPRDVTVIPGNHDIYVRGTETAPNAFWGDYMRGDDGVGGFPFLRRRGDIALIALSSALPTAPLLATGRLGQPQLTRLSELLDRTRDSFRVVLIHHPPVTPPARHLRRLVDAADLLRVLAERGAELLLHGHDHCSSVVRLEGPDRSGIPAVGVPSASARAQHHGEGAAGYNVFQIDGGPGTWRCEMVARQRDPAGSTREVERRALC